MMIGGWFVWRRLAWTWVPPLLGCLIAVVGFYHLSSGQAGRREKQAQEVEELRSKVRRLEATAKRLEGECKRLARLRNQLKDVRDDVFGTLEGRITPIMADLGKAIKKAGLKPDKFTYDAQEEKKTGLIRFGVRFSVEATFRQLSLLLAEFRASDQFLIVDRISLKGEEGAVSRKLRITLHVSTYLASADKELLRTLIGAGEDEGEGEG